MPELMTTDEAAAYLRLSERKLYELVAAAAVPCTKVTGRWLFPRAALDRWVTAGLAVPAALARLAAPPIVGGSHDPLLEWALRESGCGLASLAEGSEAGLRRLTQGEVAAAAIHLHTPAERDDNANLAAVAGAPGLYDAVVIAFARREQGILTAAGNPAGLNNFAAMARPGVRIAQRPQGAGAQLLLLALLGRAGVAPAELTFVKPVCPTGSDIAQAVRSGRADCGIATRSAAAAAGVDFVPLTWEYFDLVLRQRDFFLPPFQRLFHFLGSDAFCDHARELGGYDISNIAQVRHVN